MEDIDDDFIYTGKTMYYMLYSIIFLDELYVEIDNSDDDILDN